MGSRPRRWEGSAPWRGESSSSSQRDRVRGSPHQSARVVGAHGVQNGRSCNGILPCERRDFLSEPMGLRRGAFATGHRGTPRDGCEARVPGVPSSRPKEHPVRFSIERLPEHPIYGGVAETGFLRIHVGHLALPNPNLAVSSPKDTLRRLVGMSERSALDALSHVTSEPDSEIEGFRPLSESLEWRLAEAYWARAGVIPFVRNDVPYLVNNTGRLSDNSAALVLAALNELGPALGERVTLLELGAGTGLHARYFLDAFATRCHNEASALYDRLTYVVTDRFEGTVAGWQRDGLFAGHEDHVALRICDASAPRTMSLLGGERAPSLDAPMVVFCNYLLDVLPSTIARRARTGLEQLCVRTHVAGGVATLHAAGIASLEEARALAASGALADLTRLLPILSQLDLETAYRPWTPATRAEQTLVSAMTGPEGERGILNGGALACIDALLERTHESGFVLVNDYGPVKTEDVPAHVGVQRFGGSVALGLNFALIERVLVERGLTVLAPEGDEQRRVHTRLIGRRIGERARGVLRSRFAQETDRELDIPQ